MVGVVAPTRIGHVREQEGAAHLLWDAAAVLPAHERVHLAVLVDLAVDDAQQVPVAQHRDVLAQVGVAARQDRSST